MSQPPPLPPQGSGPPGYPPAGYSPQGYPPQAYPGGPPGPIPYAAPMIPPHLAVLSRWGMRCPRCGSPYATAVKFAWWGGFLGPKMLSHVKCSQCGNAYNGKTGRPNTTGIVIYTVVAIVLGVILAGVFYATRF
jgi:hypothetical protein